MSKKKMSMQGKLALGIVLIGGLALAAEYVLVKWYPYYQGYRAKQALNLLPYQNKKLGIDMQVAAGIYGKVNDFPGGVRIYRSHLFSQGPALIITSQSNPADSDKFSPQLLAKWQTAGTYQDIPDYRFEHTKIQGRDAVMIWQSKQHAQVLPAISFDVSSTANPLLVTAHIISPDHIVEANCRPGSDDPSLFQQACEESIKSIKVSGPLPKQPKPGILELKNVKPIQ